MNRGVILRKRGNLLGYSVRIAQRTAVEIIRNAFPAWGVFEGSTVASDGEERFEGRLVEVA